MSISICSLGNYVNVTTSKTTYNHVIICPDPNNDEHSILESSNGDTASIPNSEILQVKQI